MLQHSPNSGLIYPHLWLLFFWELRGFDLLKVLLDSCQFTKDRMLLCINTVAS